MAVSSLEPHAPAAAEDAGDDDSLRILMRWLVGLRWAVFGLLAAMLPLGERFFGFHVHYPVAVPVIAAVVLYNAVVHRSAARSPASQAHTSQRAVAFGVAVDLVAIGALLAASGGAANPFSAVFFVHVALAASLLPARTTFALAGLAGCLFAALFALPSGACCPSHPANGAFSTHLYGMWAAFVIASGLVAYFLTRVRHALDERGREIARLRRAAEESARFASLGTLAAGTAHELATPLGTIAVLAGEISAAPLDEAREHAASIAAQVTRCRDILTRMSASAQSSRLPARTEVAEAVSSAVAAWRKAHPEAQVTLALHAPEGARVPLSSEELAAALSAILDNAAHAIHAAKSADSSCGPPESGPRQFAIDVEVAREGSAIVVRVDDGGTGVARHLEGRLGEPFLTTKEPGEGMGLGLYLVRTLLAQVGGRLDVSPRAPRGTRVTLCFAEALG